MVRAGQSQVRVGGADEMPDGYTATQCGESLKEVGWMPRGDVAQSGSAPEPSGPPVSSLARRVFRETSENRRSRPQLHGIQGLSKLPDPLTGLGLLVLGTWRSPVAHLSRAARR